METIIYDNESSVRDVEDEASVNDKNMSVAIVDDDNGDSSVIDLVTLGKRGHPFICEFWYHKPSLKSLIT